MKLSLIAAVARNGVIGIENRLPWHLPEDLAFFKQTTLGCPVLMGRATYESINRPLPGRLNVVISRQADWLPAPKPDGSARALVQYPAPLPAGNETVIALAPSLQAALDWLQEFEQVFLIGGSQVYAQALEDDLIDELVLTEIAHDFEGDAYFPQWDRQAFKENSRVSNPANEQRPWGFDFVKYAKLNNKE